LLVSACSSTSSSSAHKASESSSSTTAAEASVAHARDIAAKLEAAGIGCGDATNDPGLHPDFSEVATCTIGNDQVAISLWTGHAGLLKARSDARDAACSVQRSKPSFDGTYVEGANWAVFPPQAANARKIAAVSGGTVRTVDCRGWTAPPGYSSNELCSSGEGYSVAPISGSPPLPKNWSTLSPAQLRAAGWRIVRTPPTSTCPAG